MEDHVSREAVFEFLERTLMEPDQRSEAQRNISEALDKYKLSADERAGLMRRFAVATVPTLGPSSLAGHYASIPTDVFVDNDDPTSADRLKVVDQTFDVKPIVTITTTTTTITVPTPTPIPPTVTTTVTRTAMDGLLGGVLAVDLDVIRASTGREQIDELVRLARCIEAEMA